MSTPPLDPAPILDLIEAFRRSKTMFAAVELGVFDGERPAGADVVPHAFRDHHAYSAGDVSQLVRAADGAAVVCTLKDAVKLGPLWPRQREALWYVSQRVTFDRGAEAVQTALDTAGRIGPMSP